MPRSTTCGRPTTSAKYVRRAETALLLGRQLYLLGSEESDAVLVGALADLGGADAEVERLIEAALITNGLFVVEAHPRAAERLEHVRHRAGDATLGEKLLLSLLRAYHDARMGRPAAEAVPLARRALAAGTLLREDVFGAAFVPASAVLGMADLDDAVRAFDDALCFLLAEAWHRAAFGFLEKSRAGSLKAVRRDHSPRIGRRTSAEGGVPAEPRSVSFEPVGRSCATLPARWLAGRARQPQPAKGERATQPFASP